jgi:hypothetical protein
MASPRQKRKVKRVMHEFKHGELKGGRGRRGKVKSRRQAVAIAMSESGQSRRRGGTKKTAKVTRKASGGRAKSSRGRASTRRKSTTRGRRKRAG